MIIVKIVWVFYLGTDNKKKNARHERIPIFSNILSLPTLLQNEIYNSSNTCIIIIKIICYMFYNLHLIGFTSKSTELETEGINEKKTS